MILIEGVLQRMQVAVRGQAFDCRHLRTITFQGEKGAALDRLPVHVHDAGSALAGVAAYMGAREPQPLAEEIDEQGSAFDVVADGISIHDHGYGGHGFLLLQPVIDGRQVPPCPGLDPSLSTSVRSDADSSLSRSTGAFMSGGLLRG